MKRLLLPIHRATRFALVGPHYPENLGAAARAMKTMGFSRLTLVNPGRLASPEHEMARKMAVKSLDVLESAEIVDTLVDLLTPDSLVLATTSRRGVSGVLSPRHAARTAYQRAERGGQVLVIFGNEKSGLAGDDLCLAHESVRIPMAANQPSINLAQAVQIMAYELLLAALEQSPP